MIARAVLLHLIFLAVSAAPASAANDRALTRLLQAKTQALVDSIASGGAATWDQATDPGLLFVNENNEVVPKAELLKQLTPLPPGLIGHIKVTDYKAERHGDTAVGTYIADESLDYHGQLIETKFRTTDTWRRGPKGWTMIASMTLAVLDDPPAVALPASALADYAGRYELTSDIHYTIRVDGSRLLGLRDGGKEVELKAEAADVLFVPGSPRSRKIFYRDSAGKVTGFGDRREGHDIKWRRVA